MPPAPASVPMSFSTALMSPVPQEVPLSLWRVMPLFSAMMRATVVLPVPEGAVEDHVGDTTALDGAAEHLSLGQKMLLAADIGQRFGAQTLRQRFVHRSFPPKMIMRILLFYSIAHFARRGK